MSHSINALAASIPQPLIQASIGAAIVLGFCAALVAFGRQQRRLSAMQMQLDGVSRAIRKLEVAHEGLLVRLMNLPRLRKARKSSSPSSDTPEEKMTPSVAPKQLDEKNSKGSALYVVAPKTSPE